MDKERETWKQFYADEAAREREFEDKGIVEMLQHRLEKVQQLVDQMASEIYVLGENYDENFAIVGPGEPDPILARLMAAAREERLFHVMSSESIGDLRMRYRASQAQWGV